MRLQCAARRRKDQRSRAHRCEPRHDSLHHRAGRDAGALFASGAAHRAHASTTGVTRFISERAAGFLMMRELEALRAVVENPARPSVAIMGGAKVSDKIGVIRNLMTKVDAILIGGAMAYTFLKAQGVIVGQIGRAHV